MFGVTFGKKRFHLFPGTVFRFVHHVPPFRRLPARGSITHYPSEIGYFKFLRAIFCCNRFYREKSRSSNGGRNNPAGWYPPGKRFALTDKNGLGLHYKYKKQNPKKRLFIVVFPAVVIIAPIHRTHFSAFHKIDHGFSRRYGDLWRS